MKNYLLPVIFFTSQLMGFAQLSEDQRDALESNVEIGGIRTDTWENEDDDREYEMLEVNTFQSQDDPLSYDMTRFRIRMVVELTDRDDKTYLVKYTGRAPESYHSEYQGEDYWRLYMAHGELERLKVSGYIVQFGIMDGENFVAFAADEDDSEEMLERVRNKSTVLFKQKVYLRHLYMYDDSSSGVTESVPSNVKAIEE